jgi:hypothetical protein
MPILFATTAGVTYAALFASGAIIEIAIAILTGEKESWDHSLYWSASVRSEGRNRKYFNTSMRK